MPGLVAFGRRWSVGSDDLIVPALFLIIFNSIWVVILACSLPSISAEQMHEKQAFHSAVATAQFNKIKNSKLLNKNSSRAVVEEPEAIESLLPLRFLRLLLTGFVVLFLASVLLEGGIAYVSTRGGVMQEKPRHCMKILIYLRACVLIIQLICCVLSIVWLTELYHKYYYVGAAQILIAVIVWQLLLVSIVLLTVCCVYDPTGRNWLKVAKQQEKCSKNHNHSKCHPGYKPSGSPRKSWKKRRLDLQRQNTWNRRCSWLSFCVGRPDPTNKRMFMSEYSKDSLTEIAKLLAEFFSEEDIVPTDLLAGTLLLRHKQKRTRQRALEETNSSIYQFLSGAEIKHQTMFLELANEKSLELVISIRYYMQYALAAYGWLFYMTNNKGAAFCDLFKRLRCCGCCRGSGLDDDIEVKEDNCCFCDLNALKLTLPSKEIELAYVNFHCGIGQTPFYVAVDHSKQSVVLCIRGTLSLRDLITDLTAETEEIQVPNGERHSDWLAHKGIVRASEYILSFVKSGHLFQKAFQMLEARCKIKPLIKRNLLVVGHSLGGGIATVLGFMLKVQYPSLRCFVFSPPGGLLSWAAAEATRDFVTTVVVGKDVVARLGLAQVDMMKKDMMGLLKNCKDTKWKIIGHSLPFCRADFATDSPEEPLLLEQSSMHSPAINSPLLDSELLQGTDQQSDRDQVRFSTESTPEVHLNDEKPKTTADKGVPVQKPSIVPLTLKHHSSGTKSPKLNRSQSRHQRLYLPGKVLHVVRTWEKTEIDSESGEMVISTKRSKEPSYSAIWASDLDFDEVLISPVMVHDHMPEGVIHALDKLLERCQEAFAAGPDSIAQDYQPLRSRLHKSSLRPPPDGLAPLATPDIGLRTFDFPNQPYLRSKSGPVIFTEMREKANFRVGLSDSQAEVVDSDLWDKEGDPDVESAWEDIYRENSERNSERMDGERSDDPCTPTIDRCWTATSSMVPEVSSVARLQDLDSISEGGPVKDKRVGFRAVATYGGGHLKDVGADSFAEVAEEEEDEYLKPSTNNKQELNKARSEAFLTDKDDTVTKRSPDEGKLHRTHEKEDVRYGSLNEDQTKPGQMVRSHEMDTIFTSNDSVGMDRTDSEDNLLNE